MFFDFDKKNKMFEGVNTKFELARLKTFLRFA